MATDITSAELNGEYTIDRVRRITRINSAGEIDWTLTSIEDPTVECTAEYREKTDAQGIRLARLPSAKGVTFSGSNSLLSTALLATQLGATVIEGSSANKITSTIIDDLVSAQDENSKQTFTLSHTPKAAPASIYVYSKGKTGTKVEVGTGDGQAVYASGKITLPDSYTGATRALIAYDTEIETGIKISNSSEIAEKAGTAKYVVECLFADVCDSTLKRFGYLVFPKAEIDANFTLNLNTEGTHPFTITANKDYCADNEELCYWTFVPQS